MAGLARRVFPWPLVELRGPLAAGLVSSGLLLAVLLSRLLLLPHGPWEQDEALLASGVLDFDPINHMPLPPGFPLWIFLGRVVRFLGAADPLVALQLASAVLSVAGFWALIGLWDAAVGRRVALTGALLAAFLPGVWYHAARGFSATPSAALAIVALALWVRGGDRGFVPGVAAMTAAALVRPPLAPFFALAVLLAAWRVAGRHRLLVRGAAVSLSLLVVVMVPAVLAAGGLQAFWQAGVTHAGEHLFLLGGQPAGLAGIGFVRGLGAPWAAAVFLALAAVGWFALRRRLGWRWWAGGVAFVWLAYLLLFLHNRDYPRYWVLAWMLMATPAVRGVAAVLRSRTAAAVAGTAAALAAAGWTLPAVAYVHSHMLPPWAALHEVAAEGRGLLVFQDDFFSFRNLAVREGWLTIPSTRLGEIQPRRLELAGRPIWFLTEEDGRDLPSPSSLVVRAVTPERRVRQLSQDRFLDARLVRNPVLVWQGGGPMELDGTRPFVWCGRHTELLLPALAGAGAVTFAVEVQDRLGEVGLTAFVEGRETLRTRVVGRQLVRVPIPALPRRNTLNQVVSVTLDTDREIRLMGDLRPLSIRLFGASLEAPPFTPVPYAFFPEAGSMFSAFARGEGVYSAEVIGQPPRPATWTGAEARLEMPLGAGAVGVELIAPRPQPAEVEVSLGSASARLRVGAGTARVVLPVPAGEARAGRGVLVIRSTTYSPGGGDARALGVAVARVWYAPDPDAPLPW